MLRLMRNLLKLIWCFVVGLLRSRAALEATIAALKAEGITSANALAKALNDRSIATARGGKWTARSVLNVTARLKEERAGSRSR